MAIITIPKKINKNEELIAIPRWEYAEFLALKKIKEFTPTSAEKRALARARKNAKEGNFLTLDELRNKLGFTKCLASQNWLFSYFL